MRASPPHTGFGCTAALLGPKQLGVTLDDQQPSVFSAALVSLLRNGGGVAEEVRFALEPLRLQPVVEAQGGVNRVVLAAHR